MYEFPEQALLERLVGSTLHEIGCASNLVSLRFDNGCSIFAEIGFTYVGSSGNARQIGVPLSDVALLEAVDSVVVNVRVDQAGDSQSLVIQLSKHPSRSGCIELRPHPAYESFHFLLDGREYIT